MNHSVSIDRVIGSRPFVLAFFLVFLLIGFSVYGDFGIGIDETINHMNGLVSLRFIFDKFHIHCNLTSFAANIPHLYDYGESQYYGVIFDLPLTILEVMFNLHDPRALYLARHLATFLLFYTSVIVFYRLLHDVFEHRVLALAGVCFLIFSPRIFAHSFTNPKDIPLLSFVIFSAYFNLKFLRSDQKTHLWLAAFFTAMAVILRVFVLYIPCLTLFFYLFKIDDTNKKLILVNAFIYAVLIPFFMYLFWPYLWENPLPHFMRAVLMAKQWKLINGHEVLYLGHYLVPTSLPWHYLFVWILMTTPCVFSLFAFLGVFKQAKIFLINFLNIESMPHHVFWRNTKEMSSLYMFFVFFIPVFALIAFNATIYNGWRIFYFVYPAMIFVGVAFLDGVFSSKKAVYINLCYVLILGQVICSGVIMVQSHPNQQAYFNALARYWMPDIDKKFPVDYWGLSNHVALKKLLSGVNHTQPVKIGKASWTVDLNKIRPMLDRSLWPAYQFVWGDFKEADYILTNYVYPYNPKVKRKAFAIPANFSSYAKLKVNGVLVNEIFKRKTKESS